MRILVIGAGGVGSSVVPIAIRRDFFEGMVVADYDLGRAERAVARFAGDPRLVAARVDASRSEAVAALCREHRISHVLNAVDPRFVMPIFEGAFAAGAALAPQPLPFGFYSGGFVTFIHSSQPRRPARV